VSGPDDAEGQLIGVTLVLRWTRNVTYHLAALKMGLPNSMVRPGTVNDIARFLSLSDRVGISGTYECAIAPVSESHRLPEDPKEGRVRDGLTHWTKTRD
jgi:hypothetical protein